MRVDIYINNQKLTTEINSPLKVKEMILNVQSFLKENNKNYKLITSEHITLKDEDIIEPKEKECKFFMVETNLNIENNKKEQNDKISNEDIKSLIMKTTGAKKALDIKPQPFAINNQFGENNNFNRLMELLQVFEETNLINRMNNPLIVPNLNNNNLEVNEQNLRELVSMGFPEDRAREALINSRNNLNRATDLLLGGSGD